MRPVTNSDFQWWSCERKVRFDTEPAFKPGMKSYECKFCGGWHRASLRDRRGKRVVPKPPRKSIVVLRGGYWIER